MSIYDDAAAQWNIDPLLLRAMEQVESRGRTDATSSAGAEGNMQIMPDTGRRLAVTDARNTAFSVPGAAKLMHTLLTGPAQGDPILALRMYQGGEDRAKWGAQNAAYPKLVGTEYAKLRSGVPQPAVQAAFNPATMSDAELDKALTGSVAPSQPAAPDPATMSDEELDAHLSGKPQPQFKVVPVHPAPDGSGAMTNLSDEDYAKFQKQAAESKPAPASAEPAKAVDVGTPSIGNRILSDYVEPALKTAAGITGAVTHGLSFGLDRQLNKLLPDTPLQRYANEQQAQFEQSHPVLNAVGEAVGAIPTYVTGEGALQRVLPEVAGAGMMNSAGNLLRAGARNALVSGALGFGTQDGDLAERGIAGAKGAVAGAVAPPLFAAVGSAIRRAVSPIMARMSGDLASRQAVGEIGKAMLRDATSPADAAAELQRLGPQAALVDAGGANLRRLGESVANAPGPAAAAAEGMLEGRAATQAGRLNQAITAATGSTGDFHAAMGELAAKRATEAAPKYAAAFDRIKVTPEEAATVQRFVRDSIGQQALQRGMRVIELEKLAADQPFNPADYAVKKEGSKFVLGSDTPNLRLFDAIKRGYDEIVEGFRDPTTGRLNLNQYGRAVNEVRAEYVKSLREMFPRYASALDAWAGPSRAMDALSMGRNVLKRDPEVTTKAINGLSDTDKQFFLSGVARALKDKIEGAQDGADATRRMFGNQLIRDKIKAALGSDKAFNEFAKTMEREAVFAQTRNEILKGSQTARRLAGQEDVGVDLWTPAVHAAHGNPLGAALNLGAQAMNRLRAPSAATNAPLGRMLFQQRPMDQELLDALARVHNPLAAPLARRAISTTANRLVNTP